MGASTSRVTAAQRAAEVRVDDMAYSLRRANARIKVLEEDLVQARQNDSGVSSRATEVFSLIEAPSNGHARNQVAFRVGSSVGSLCRDAGTATIFHVSLWEAAAADLPLFAFLQALCPGGRDDARDRIVLSSATLRAAALITRGAPLRLAARVETFNVHVGDLDATALRGRTRDCRRLSVPSGMTSALIAPGVVNVTVPTNLRAGVASGRRVVRAADCETLFGWGLAGEHAVRLKELCPRGWRRTLLRPGSGSAASGASVKHLPNSSSSTTSTATASTTTASATTASYTAATPAFGRGHSSGVVHRWLRVLGDSVTASLLGGIRSAFFGGLDVELGRLTSKGGQLPVWKVWRASRSAGFAGGFLSYENFKDFGYQQLDLPADAPGDVYRLMRDAVSNGAGGGEGRVLAAASSSMGPPLIYLSLGSHAKSIGGDNVAEARFSRALATFLRVQPEGTKLILALETARGIGATPSRFQGLSVACLISNLRYERRGQASARALRTACPDRERCLVLDLFRPTLAHVFDPLAYVQGDPVHIRKTHWLEAPLRDALSPPVEGGSWAQPPAPARGRIRVRR